MLPSQLNEQQSLTVTMGQVRVQFTREYGLISIAACVADQADSYMQLPGSRADNDEADIFFNDLITLNPSATTSESA